MQDPGATINTCTVALNWKLGTTTDVSYPAGFFMSQKWDGNISALFRMFSKFFFLQKKKKETNIPLPPNYPTTYNNYGWSDSQVVRITSGSGTLTLPLNLTDCILALTDKTMPQVSMIFANGGMSTTNTYLQFESYRHKPTATSLTIDYIPAPTPHPTPQPTPHPTPHPTPQPTPHPTPQPTPFPTPSSLSSPTPFPTPSSVTFSAPSQYTTSSSSTSVSSTSPVGLNASNNNSNVGLIVGSIVAVLVVIAIVGVSIFVLFRWRRRTQMSSNIKLDALESKIELKM